MIHEWYEEAGKLHGHYCPGLAIGVRAAAEALEILGTEEENGRYCIAESRACYIDGIQWVFGTSLGNGRLEIRDRGKVAFNFYDRTSGKGVRLVDRDWPKDLDRPALIEYLLTAPREQVFSLTEVRFDPPPDIFVREPSQKCAHCGEDCRESALRVRNGALVCMDCAETIDRLTRE